MTLISMGICLLTTFADLILRIAGGMERRDSVCKVTFPRRLNLIRRSRMQACRRTWKDSWVGQLTSGDSRSCGTGLLMTMTCVMAPRSTLERHAISSSFLKCTTTAKGFQILAFANGWRDSGIERSGRTAEDIMIRVPQETNRDGDPTTSTPPFETGESNHRRRCCIQRRDSGVDLARCSFGEDASWNGS